MKLYDADFAPSPRRVRIFLAEKGIEVPVVKVDLRNGEHFQGEFRRVNPYCTVPALEFDNGSYLHEIPAICLYFEALHPEPPLMGLSPKEKARVMMWDRHMEQDGFTAVRDAFRNANPAFKGRALPGPHKVEQIPDLAERGRRRYALFLQNLDESLSRSEFVAGSSYTIADITALTTIDFARATKVGDIGDYDNVQRWHEQVNARPSAQA